MNDALTSLREHAPTLPSAKDAREAVMSRLPSVDVDVVRDHLPSRGKRTMIAAIVGGLAAAAAVFGFARRRRAQASEAALYTPPLPRP